MTAYKKNAYTYILRCCDDSLYTGFTTDISRREKEHTEKIGSKYVFSKGFKKMEIAFVLNNKSEAMSLEYYIKKRLNKSQKERIIKGHLSIIYKAGFDIKEVIYY